MLQELFHVDGVNVGSIPFIEFEKSGSRVLLSLRDRKIHKLTREGVSFKQEGSVPLLADLVSLSSGCNDLVTVGLSNGSILLCNWEGLFRMKTKSSRKRTFDEANETDIFTSLLNEGVRHPESSQQHDGTSAELLKIAAAPLEYDLLSCRLTIGRILVGFCVLSNDTTQLCLLLWRQQMEGVSMEYMPTPTSILLHKHVTKNTSGGGSSVDCRERLPPIPSEIVSCGRVSSNNSADIVHLNETLYSYLFGLEDVLSKSLIVLYGWLCGCVLAVSLTKPISFSCNSPKVICSLDETVIAIHSFSTGPQAVTDDICNALMFIGSSGKLILFIAQERDVRHYELFVAGPVLSSLLVPGLGLLVSSLDAVQWVCLKGECCAGKMTQDCVEVFHVFESAVTVLDSALFLLLFVADRSCVIGVTFEGRIVSAKLHLDAPVGFTTPTPLTTASKASESIKSSLMSIQNSSNVLAQVQSSVRCLDEALLSLNETMSFFRKLSSDRIETPLKVTPRVAYEQTGVDEYRSYLELLFVYKDVRPLRSGVSLIVEIGFDRQQRLEAFMESRVSDKDMGATFCQVFPLGGLQRGSELRLQPKLPDHFYSNSRLRISCWCSYSPLITETLLQHDSYDNDNLAMVLFYQKNLIPLDFLNPLKTLNCRQTDHTHKTASFNITLNTLSKLSDVTVAEELLSSKLLSSLISDSQQVREAVEEFTTTVCSVRGRCLELRAICSSEIVLIRLCGNTDGSHQFTLSVSSFSLEMAVVICDNIVQRIKQKCGQTEPNYVEVLLRNVDKKSFDLCPADSARRPEVVAVCQIQEALKEYFQGLTL